MKYYFPIQVRFADTDLQGHVFFGTYLTYFDEAASGLLRALGYSYPELRARNLDIVYARAECDYIAAAQFEDLLYVYARVARIGTTSMTFECAAQRATDQMLVARGKIVCVLRDATTHAKMAVPEELRRAVQEFEMGA